MKRLLITLGAGLGALALATPALSDEPPQKPYPGKTLAVMLYADTVTSARTAPRPSKVCSQTNFFPQGTRVVFRVWGIETRTGKILTPANVKYAYIKIAGQPNLKLTFGAHGTAPNQVWFWSAAWAIPTNYPLGVVAYRIVVKTKSNKFGIFDPTGLADGSRLTVTPKQ
jgi:hypothetical protein